MMNLSRNRRAAALGLLLAAAWPGALAAQDTNTVVGNPQLRGFQLPGQRTTPPATVQAPPATAPAAPPTTAPSIVRAPAPAAAVPAPPPAAAPRDAAPTRAERRSPASRREPPAAPPIATTSAPAPVVQAPAPAAQTAPPVTAPAPAPAPVPAQPAPATAAAPESSGLTWLWILLPLLLIGLGAFAFLRRNRAITERNDAHRSALAGSLVAGDRPRPPEPAPAEPVPEPAVTTAPETAPAEAPRPWLEIDIEPDRAAATQSEASLHYDLVVTNVGGETARNIRIDTRMFNAADEQDIAAFLGGPIHRHSGSPHITLPPGESMRLTSAIGMKTEEVRAIELQGRRIFVPSVAINLAYDWNEDGEGRTSKSWLVGRKPDNPQARMGAFRLDLGPRIYRSVDRKDTKRVMV